MTFCYHCLKCGTRRESSDKQAPRCDCGTPMVRDYRAEAVGNTFTPTKGRDA